MADEQVTANVRLTAPDETSNVMVQLLAVSLVASGPAA